jgi:riboflavin synthase
MFTGIVEEIGEVVAVREHADVVVLTVRGRTVTADAGHGDSIAVNGVCLTVIDPEGSADGTFTVELVPETLKRSSLAAVTTGARVNLERALPANGRLGGHIVQGHVDARGHFLSATEHGGSWTLRIAYPRELARYLVFKGSVTVEGISLTVAALTDEYFEIAIIPKTWEVTNLAHLRSGDEVNLEADIIAKYVERILMVSRKEEAARSGLTIEKLADLGYK